MHIAMMADNNKKELLVDICIAYRDILLNHELYATDTTAQYISDLAGFPVKNLLAGSLGGINQLITLVSYNTIDMLIYLRDCDKQNYASPDVVELMRMCDMYNVPMATNLSVADVLIRALGAGDFDWRNFDK